MLLLHFLFFFLSPPTTQHNTSDIAITHTNTRIPHPIQTQTNQQTCCNPAGMCTLASPSVSLSFHFHEPCTCLSAPKAIFYFPRSASVILHPKKQSFLIYDGPSPVLMFSAYRIRLFVVCSHLSFSLPTLVRIHIHTTFVIVFFGLDTKSGKKNKAKRKNLVLDHWALANGPWAMDNACVSRSTSL